MSDLSTIYPEDILNFAEEIYDSCSAEKQRDTGISMIAELLTRKGDAQ